MAYNLDRMNEVDEGEQRFSKKGQKYKWEEGWTSVYLCPPMAGMLELPFLPVSIHQLGPPFPQKGGRSVICLDQESNGNIFTDEMLEALEARKESIRIDEGCPVHDLLNGSLKLPYGQDVLDRMVESRRYHGAIVPWAWADPKDGKFRDFPANKRKPTIVDLPPSLYAAFIKQIRLSGEDIDNPNAAVLLIVEMVKKEFTEYEVYQDRKSVQNPIKLSKSLQEAIEEGQTPGGVIDVVGRIANFLKSRDQIMELLEGFAVEKRSGSVSSRGGTRTPSVRDNEARRSRSVGEEEKESPRRTSRSKAVEEEEEEESPRKSSRLKVAEEEESPRASVRSGRQETTSTQRKPAPPEKEEEEDEDVPFDESESDEDFMAELKQKRAGRAR